MRKALMAEEGKSDMEYRIEQYEATNKDLERQVTVYASLRGSISSPIFGGLQIYWALKFTILFCMLR